MVKIPYRTTYWQKNYLGSSRTVPAITVQPGSYQENSPELKDRDMDSIFRDGEQKQTPRFQKLSWALHDIPAFVDLTSHDCSAVT